MRELPKANEVYRHFKGNDYEVISLATNSENGEQQVVYKALYPPYTIYVRPLEMFMEEVNKEKYPNATQQYRFEKKETLTQEQLDPNLVAFLDAQTYEEKIEILVSMHNTITEELITAMAISMDYEICEGTIEERYQSLKKCILTRQEFEGSRLR